MSTYKSQTDQIPDRVESGVRYLDEREGKDWIWKVDLLHLDMNQWKHCICGQLGFNLERTSLKLIEENTSLGFTPPLEFTPQSSYMYIGELQEYWKQRIRELRHIRVTLKGA